MLLTKYFDKKTIVNEDLINSNLLVIKLND